MRFLILIVSIAFSFDLFPQDIRFCGTEFIESPDKMYSIAFDHCINETGACTPFTARILKMPLKIDSYVKIDISYPIAWSPNSDCFAYTRPPKNSNSNSYKIEIVDTTGKVIDSIGNAFSPSWWWTSIYYFSEFDEKNNVTNPRIMKYDTKSKKIELVYQFDSSYSFWTEIVDGCCMPRALKYDNHWPSGFKGIIYSKNKIEEEYTFIISGNKLVYWHKENYYDSHYLPMDGVIKDK